MCSSTWPPTKSITLEDRERLHEAFDARAARRSVPDAAPLDPPSTRTVYASAWHKWEEWCDVRGIAAMPCHPDALAAYLAERAEEGLTYASIDVACCAVSYRHRQHGLTDPTADPTLRRVRRGLRRIIGVAPRRQAHPLDVTELARIVNAIEARTPHGLRDRAIILLGYAAAVRPGELAALQLADIVFRPNGLLITIRRSKNDQEGHGQMIGVVRGTKATTDPVAAVGRWPDVRPRGSGPLFTRIHNDGAATLTSIGARTVSRMIQARARATGVGHLPITGHSLRAGRATTAAANGASIARIAAHTRHRDLETLVEHYIRPTDALATSTSRDLDQSRPRTLTSTRGYLPLDTNHRD